MIHAYFELVLPIKMKKEEGLFISSCPALDVHSQGATSNEAKKNLGEAIQLFITTCFEMGTLDAVLKGCGFQATKKEGRP